MYIHILYTHNTCMCVQRFGIGEISSAFEIVSYAQQDCINLLKNTVILWNIITILEICFQSCIFSIITPVCSVTWPFRNPSNMDICRSRNIIIHIWKQLNCIFFFFCGICDIFYFQDSLMNRKLKRTALVWKINLYSLFWSI